MNTPEELKRELGQWTVKRVKAQQSRNKLLIELLKDTSKLTEDLISETDRLFKEEAEATNKCLELRLKMQSFRESA